MGGRLSNAGFAGRVPPAAKGNELVIFWLSPGVVSDSLTFEIGLGGLDDRVTVRGYA